MGRDWGERHRMRNLRDTEERDREKQTREETQRRDGGEETEGCVRGNKQKERDSGKETVGKRRRGRDWADEMDGKRRRVRDRGKETGCKKSSPRSHVLVVLHWVLSWLSDTGNRVLSVLNGSPVLAFLICMPSSSCPVLRVQYGLSFLSSSFLAVLSQLSWPCCFTLNVLSKRYYPNALLAVLFCPIRF